MTIERPDYDRLTREELVELLESQRAAAHTLYDRENEGRRLSRRCGTGPIARALYRARHDLANAYLALVEGASALADTSSPGGDPERLRRALALIEREGWYTRRAAKMHEEVDAMHQAMRNAVEAARRTLPPSDGSDIP